MKDHYSRSRQLSHSRLGAMGDRENRHHERKKGRCRLLIGEQGFSKLHQRRVCALVWGSVSPITPHLIGPPAVELQAVEQVRGLIYMQCGTKCLLLVHCQ